MSKESETKKQSAYKPVTPAVEQASRLLVHLGKSPNFRMTLTEICEQIGIHKSKGHSILNTMKQFGLVDKDPRTKTWSLGPGLVSLARKVLDNLDVREIASPFLARVAEETKSAALLGVVDGDQVYVAAKHEGNEEIGVTIRVGQRFHITRGAHGKAIVAFMKEADRERILKKKNLFFHGAGERLDRERLKKEFARCVESGFASDAGELHQGVNAVCAPMFGPFGDVAACFLLIGTFPVRRIDDYGRQVAMAAQTISRKLGAQRRGGGAPLPLSERGAANRG